jgi:hypothetical protein
MGTGHVGAAIQRLRRDFRPNAPAAPPADLRDDPLPTGEEALVEPFAAFRSWFLRSPATAAARSGFSTRRTPRSALCRSAPSAIECATTAAADGRGGGTARRHRGHQQPAGEADPAAGGVRRGDTGWTACWAECRRSHAAIARTKPLTDLGISHTQSRPPRRGSAMPTRTLRASPDLADFIAPSTTATLLA